MNEELKKIFGEEIQVIRDDKEVSIPTAHLVYNGKSEEYVIWTILSNKPELCADDEVLYSVYEVDVDIYSKSNYLDIVSKVKSLMKNNLYVWVEDSPEMYETDTGYYHLTCTFEKERMN